MLHLQIVIHIKIRFITNYGNLTLNDCLVVNNKSYGNGGAIMNGDHLILNNTFLSGNTDSGNGGAIYNLFGIMKLMEAQLRLIMLIITEAEFIVLGEI